MAALAYARIGVGDRLPPLTVPSLDRTTPMLFAGASGEHMPLHIDIDGRDIKVGVNADLLAMMERTIPLGRGGTPEEAAGAAYLFCIPESDHVSAQTLMCTGVLTGV